MLFGITNSRHDSLFFLTSVQLKVTTRIITLLLHIVERLDTLFRVCRNEHLAIRLLTCHENQFPQFLIV